MLIGPSAILPLSSSGRRGRTFWQGLFLEIPFSFCKQFANLCSTAKTPELQCPKAFVSR
jgi:hypothetical protein